MGIRPVVLLSPTPSEGALHLPVIETEFIHESVLLTGCEAVIFTSKQAVSALDSRCQTWKNLKIFSVGAGTSRAVSEAGATVFYEASKAYGDNLAQEIAEKFPDLFYYYPRAETVVSDLESILKVAGVRLRSQTLYRTRCRTIETALIPENAALVFTAPSTVNCFFKQTDWQTNWRAVAIGDRTADALRTYVNPFVSPEPAIDAAVALASEL